MAISGAGAEVTALAESLQAYACAARQALRKDLKTIEEITDKNTRDADCDRKLSDCIKKLDEAWYYSCIQTANQMAKDFRFGNYKFYRGGNIPNSIYSVFTKYKKESGLTGSDKWNPADIWIKSKAHTLRTDFDNLTDYNKYIYDAFKKRDLIGISLKKIGPQQRAKPKVFNDGKPLDAKFKGFKIGNDPTNSKDAYIEFVSESGPGMVQLRNFSSRAVPSSWQGEIKGKYAAAGKMGGGVLLNAAKEAGVNNAFVPKDLWNKIENANTDTVKEFCKMFKDITIVSTSIDQLIPLVAAKAKVDKTWWMSKYFSVAYCYMMKQNKKEDKIANAIYSYASSASKFSSVFIKYS